MFAIESNELTVIPDQGRFRILDIPNKILLREAFHSRKILLITLKKQMIFLVMSICTLLLIQSGSVITRLKVVVILIKVVQVAHLRFILAILMHILI